MKCLAKKKNKSYKRASTHYFAGKKQIINKQKHSELKALLEETKELCQFFVDYLWDNKISFAEKTFDRKNDLLDCPSFLSTTEITLPKNLRHFSARLVKAISTQACSKVRSALEKRRKRLFVRDKLISEGKNCENLQKKLDEEIPGKPILKNFNLELDSNNADIQETDGAFDAFLQIKTLGKKYGKIRIPIKMHRQALRWQNQGTMMNGFLVSKNYINIRWEVPMPEKKESGKTVGADQGALTAISLSDGQTAKPDRDGWTMDLIMKKLARKEKDSIAFEKAQRHRDNYIGWALNQLKLDGIKEFRLEKIYKIRRGKRTSRYLSHWTATQTSEKVQSLCEENGVHFRQQSSAFRSQRCSSCGLVLKKNRKGKVFCCSSCGYTDDSDLNAAKNHEANLPSAPMWLTKGKANREGFYWQEDGFFHMDGTEFTVPHCPYPQQGKVP